VVVAVEEGVVPATTFVVVPVEVIVVVVVGFVEYVIVLVPTRHIDDTIVPTVDNKRPHLDIYESF
jgi:hypothetical protein